MWLMTYRKPGGRERRIPLGSCQTEAAKLVHRGAQRPLLARRLLQRGAALGLPSQSGRHCGPLCHVEVQC